MGNSVVVPQIVGPLNNQGLEKTKLILANPPPCDSSSVDAITRGFSGRRKQILHMGRIEHVLDVPLSGYESKTTYECDFRRGNSKKWHHPLRGAPDLYPTTIPNNKGWSSTSTVVTSTFSKLKSIPKPQAAQTVKKGPSLASPRTVVNSTSSKTGAPAAASGVSLVKDSSSSNANTGATVS